MKIRPRPQPTLIRIVKWINFIVPLLEGAIITFPVSMTTPIELSSLAWLNARISSLTVSGLNAFLLSGRLIVIFSRKCNQLINDEM
jgi:hypothetical protein